MKLHNLIELLNRNNGRDVITDWHIKQDLSCNDELIFTVNEGNHKICYMPRYLAYRHNVVIDFTLFSLGINNFKEISDKFREMILC